MTCLTMTDLRATMRATASLKGARTIVCVARRRLGDIEAIHMKDGKRWPALEESLRREQADVLAIAKARGFVL